MPSTAVAARINSWKRIAHRYKKHTREYYAKKQSNALTKAKLIASRKAFSKR